METISPVATEFILFCQQRCSQGWPALYDEMCWVAGHRLFRGMGYLELSQLGLSFGLTDIEATISLVEAVTCQSRNLVTKA